MTIQRLSTRIMVFVAIGFLLACGNGSIHNENIPISVESISNVSLSPREIQDNTNWTQLAAALGLNLDSATSNAELRTRRETRSKLLSKASREEYLGYLETLKGDWTSKGYASQCGAVTSVEEIHQARYLNSDKQEKDISGVRVFQMNYRLQADFDGTPESTDRSGILVMPDKGTLSEPILLFAHGGTGGLSYQKLMQAVGTLQSGHVVVAPTYPGEPLCMGDTNDENTDCDSEGARAKAVGEKSTFDQDSDEVLGIYDCIVRAHSGIYDTPEPVKITWLDKDKDSVNFSTYLQLALPTNGSGYLDFLPKSLILGESRGGMTALLALAKAGVQYDVMWSQWKEKLGKDYSAPPLFSCAGFIGSPVGLTSGRLQLGLEYLVKGTYARSAFSQIPGFDGLESLVKDYRENPDVTHLNSLVVEVMKRDPILLSPFILKALRNWSSVKSQTGLGDKSAMIFLHGTEDKVVPFDQSRVAHNTFLDLSDSEDTLEVSRSAGTYVYTRGFEADSKSIDGSLHLGENFYQNSHAVLPGDFINAEVVKNALIDASLEATAVKQTETFYATRNPSAQQLAVARNYVGSGYFADFTAKLTDGGGIAETKSDGTELIRPIDLLEEWRYNQGFGCQLALTRDVED